MCMWAYFIQNTMNQIRDSIVGCFEPRDHEVHGNCILLGEGASIEERQLLSKMSTAILCPWLAAALTVGIYSSETKYDFKNSCKTRKALITIQTTWHEN